MTIHFGPDPVSLAVSQCLDQLESGVRPKETQHVDLKEDSSLRGPGGTTASGDPHSDRVAQQVAGWSACMANTPGGGAIIVGVSDKNRGEEPLLRGTTLDADWLRYRVYELTNRLLTIDIRELTVNGVRLLVIRTPEALEPIRWKGRIRWRVDDHCVEIDAATWHEKRLHGLRVDWSAQPSAYRPDDIPGTAVEYARDFLRQSPDASAQELAQAATPDLLRRLNTITGDGFLTNAAALVFIGRPEPALDYIRREGMGQDSQERIREPNAPLITQLAHIFTIARAYNPQSHIENGLMISQVRAIPERAFREAIVNGVAHREWRLPDPTVVEHIGNSLRVVSPGGFIANVTEANIITHPSLSRNTALTELLAALKIAEREGIGVDRMITDMLSIGLARPVIREIEGPYVETVLIGGQPDSAWLDWLGEIDDNSQRQFSNDLRPLMALRELLEQQWIDVNRLAVVTQSTVPESEPWITALEKATLRAEPLVEAVPTSADTGMPAFILTAAAWTEFVALRRSAHRQVVSPSPEEIAKNYARGRGRISTTELASIMRQSRTGPSVRDTLKALENDGVLVPSNPSHAGRGFHYIWHGQPGAEK